MRKKSTSTGFQARKRLLIPVLLGAAMCLPFPQVSAESHVYGYLGYYQPESEDDYRAGWYRINTEDGTVENIWLDQVYGMFGTYFNVGYIRDNKLCGYYGNASMYFYVEFDLRTGDQVTQREIDVQRDNAYRQLLSGAYSKADDCIYGFSTDVSKTTYYLVKAKASDPENAEIVREVPEDFIIPVSCCFNPNDNHIYGIDQLGDLIRVDIHGNFEWVGAFYEMSGETTPDIAGWEAGMTYSPRDNAFIWNRHRSTYDTMLYRIDAATYKWTKLSDLNWADQFTILDCTDTDGDDNGPVAPQLVSKEFADGVCAGKLVYRMPEKLANGEDAPATMDWIAYDGASTKKGTAAPGEEVTVEYEGLANGEHNFRFRAMAGTARGASIVSNFWVGFDNPLPPSDITLSPIGEGEFTLTWKAPEGGAHASYVNPENLAYTVMLDGETVKGSISECSTTVTLPTDVETRRYSFQVVATADGMQSRPGRSNYVFTGRGYNLPVNITPTQEEAANMTIINVDGDKSNWSYVTEVGLKTPAFYTSRDWDNKGNDWLITPPLWMDDPSKLYNVTFEVKYHNELKAEEFYEVWLGTAPTEDDIRAIRITPKTRVNDKRYYEVSYDFEIPSTDTYYLGIRYNGDADQGGIYVRNLSISKTNKNSGIETAVEGTLSVSGGNGVINLTSDEAVTVDIYSADGRHIRRANVKGELSVTVEKGIYLVRTGRETYKINVK